MSRRCTRSMRCVRRPGCRRERHGTRSSLAAQTLFSDEAPTPCQKEVALTPPCAVRRTPRLSSDAWVRRHHETTAPARRRRLPPARAARGCWPALARARSASPSPMLPYVCRRHTLPSSWLSADSCASTRRTARGRPAMSVRTRARPLRRTALRTRPLRPSPVGGHTNGCLILQVAHDVRAPGSVAPSSTAHCPGGVTPSHASNLHPAHATKRSQPPQQQVRRRGAFRGRLMHTRDKCALLAPTGPLQLIRMVIQRRPARRATKGLSCRGSSICSALPLPCANCVS
jgi:hypothetical protein